jgi:hypothetical protein
MPSDRELKRLDDLCLYSFPDSEFSMRIRVRRLREGARGFGEAASGFDVSIKRAADSLSRLVDIWRSRRGEVFKRELREAADGND